MRDNTTEKLEGVVLTKAQQEELAKRDATTDYDAMVAEIEAEMEDDDEAEQADNH